MGLFPHFISACPHCHINYSNCWWLFCLCNYVGFFPPQHQKCYLEIRLKSKDFVCHSKGCADTGLDKLLWLSKQAWTKFRYTVGYIPLKPLLGFETGNVLFSLNTKLFWIHWMSCVLYLKKKKKKAKHSLPASQQESLVMNVLRHLCCLQSEWATFVKGKWDGLFIPANSYASLGILQIIPWKSQSHWGFNCDHPKYLSDVLWWPQQCQIHEVKGRVLEEFPWVCQFGLSKPFPCPEPVPLFAAVLVEHICFQEMDQSRSISFMST